jgi:hypothetical protein
LFERSNLHHCLSPPIPNQSSPPVARFRRLVTIYHMQKFEGKSCIFGVLTKILLNTRNELTSFLPLPIMAYLHHGHPSPHPTPAASRVHRRPVVDEKRRWDFDGKLVLGVMFWFVHENFDLTPPHLPSPANHQTSHPIWPPNPNRFKSINDKGERIWGWPIAGEFCCRTFLIDLPSYFLLIFFSTQQNGHPYAPRPN